MGQFLAREGFLWLLSILSRLIQLRLRDLECPDLSMFFASFDCHVRPAGKLLSKTDYGQVNYGQDYPGGGYKFMAVLKVQPVGLLTFPSICSVTKAQH